MYEISVQQHFDAAHYLRSYKGKCEALHGHRFEVRVSIQRDELDDSGLAYDFTELKRHLGEILSRFDHACLNEIPPFDDINPSSENIATNIYQELQVRLKEEPVTISRVTVWESPNAAVTFTP
jgi:6-pyruvoyltetrahydropterin/6-carboxytetrahydropterin synthase